MRLLSASLAATLLLTVGCATSTTTVTPLAQPGISHDVFFTMQDGSDEVCDGLVAACERLAGIPGVQRVVVGRRDPSQTREVNDQNYHVGLHVEFVDQAAYDVYSPHPIHQALITDFGSGFKEVVVFDSLVQPR